MANALQLALVASLTGYFRGANDVANPQQDFSLHERVSLTTGTTANKADQVFSDSRTIAASGSESLDLAGSLTNAFGESVTFAEVVAIVVVADAGNTNDVVVGGASENAFAAPFGDASDKVKVKPGGFLVLAAPGDPAYAVTAGTGDLLQIANSSSGSAVGYDIVILGRSA